MTKEIQVPTIYQASPDLAKAYQDGYKDAMEGHKAKNDGLLLSHQGPGVLGAYKAGYNAGEGVKAPK